MALFFFVPLVSPLLRRLWRIIGQGGRVYLHHVQYKPASYRLSSLERQSGRKAFWGKFPLERATSFFFYRKGSDFRQVLHQLKYGGQKEIGAIMGRYMASELQASDFFHGVDVIIPIPLHKKKQQIRGYNQSEWISRGIMAVTGIPVDTEAIIRRKNTETQTQKSALERWENVDGIFELHRSEHLAGKHILIVDDVLTTGATTVACASRLAEIEGVRISVLTLAMAE